MRTGAGKGSDPQKSKAIFILPPGKPFREILLHCIIRGLEHPCFMPGISSLKGQGHSHPAKGTSIWKIKIPKGKTFEGAPRPRPGGNGGHCLRLIPRLMFIPHQKLITFNLKADQVNSSLQSHDQTVKSPSRPRTLGLIS